MADLAGALATLILAALAGLHVYWATTDHAALATVVPTVEGEPLFRPTRFATFGVALLLTLAAGVLIGARGWLGAIAPRWLFRAGAGGVALVFLLRAVGDFHWVGFFKTHQGTRFASLDSALYSPLCVALFLASALAAIGS